MRFYSSRWQCPVPTDIPKVFVNHRLQTLSRSLTSHIHRIWWTCLPTPPTYIHISHMHMNDLYFIYQGQWMPFAGIATSAVYRIWPKWQVEFNRRKAFEQNKIQENDDALDELLMIGMLNWHRVPLENWRTGNRQLLAIENVQRNFIMWQVHD